jgi:circadian clock protein KaiB
VVDPIAGNAREAAAVVGVDRRFKVFVAGTSWRSQRVVRVLHELCQAHGLTDYEVEIVDVLLDPSSAELDRVLALPMVMRLAPEPVVRVVGDLSDAQVAADVLGLSPERLEADPGMVDGGQA